LAKVVASLIAISLIKRLRRRFGGCTVHIPYAPCAKSV